MQGRHTETPLFALEAVVIDTETTSLDPDKARIIEIGAMVWPENAGDSGTFETFVSIEGSIPGPALEVTGISDDMLRGAPDFPAAFDRLRGFCGDRILVGHSFGYDIAVFASECRRHDVPAWQPVFLDTRFLAQLVLPELPDYSMEVLAERLHLNFSDRHRALADARLTAHIFAALVPLLRERGIRTAGEAISACKRFEDRGDYPTMWAPLAQGFSADEGRQMIAPLDTFLFTKTVATVMTGQPQFASPAATIGEAARQMAEARCGSLFIGEAGDQADQLGIVTERDVLGAIGKMGAAALDGPVGTIASRPLQSVVSGAFMYRAIGRMARLGIRHLGVADEGGRIIGAVSARDLLKSRMSEPVMLADGIDNATDEQELGRIWAQVPSAVRAMLSNGMDGREVAAIVAREVAALTRRSAMFAEQRLRDEGAGDPPCAYAVLVLGSAGRGESLLAFDQDNAIVFEHGEEGGAEDAWFAKLGAYMCDTLHAVGVPLCKGGVMASNAAWRGSVATWERRAGEWISRSRPQDLLAVDIFYDFRPVHGALAMAEQMWQRIWSAVEGQVTFLKVLAESAGGGAGPFGFFGNLQTENGRVDLKLHGLKHVVTAARILALRHQVLERATMMRLTGLAEKGLDPTGDLQALSDAQRFFLTRIADQQVQDMADGYPAGNKVDVSRLAKSTRGELTSALKRMELVAQIVRDQLTA